ncbi:MAG: hypothetical protein J1F66_05360 [Clostridiales bacterium]|nr:hypothetical protein [Clostridiales bacterium]
MTATIQSQGYVTVKNSSISMLSSTPLTYDTSSSQVVEWVFSDNTKISGAELKLRVVPSTKVMLSTDDVYSYEYNIYNINRLSDETVTVTVSITNYKGYTTNDLTSLTASSQYNITIKTNLNLYSGTIKLQVVALQYSFDGHTVTYTIELDPDLFTGTTLNLEGYFASGDGSSSNPYQISNERQLQNIVKTKTNIGAQSYITSNFKLTNNITLASTWTPIPSELMGKFDGNNKTIYNLKFSVGRLGGYYGLFEKIDSGTIQNLAFSDVKITCSSTSSLKETYVGVIAGLSRGTISDCIVKGAIDVQIYNANVGGIVGSNRGAINTCVNYISISGSGNIGGIAGHASFAASAISNCINYGTISYYYNTQNGTAGGIVGLSQESALVKSCTNNALIKYGSDKSDNKDIAPCMGQIIGWNLSGLAPESCSIRTSGGTDYSNLQKVGGFLGIGKTDQARYCSNYEVGLTGAK